MKKTLVILIFGFLTLSSVSAQKFGYVNSQELLASMPDVKNADNQLKSFQDPLIKKGQDMVDALEAEYGKYMEDVNNGLLSNVQRQQKEQDIQSKQVNIQNYQAEVQEKILKKREELYQPILDKVNNTIKKYGEDNGYTMIFDTSVGGILHGTESDNLLAALKTKLGI
ncbi:MAG TPA: OmpH family outer membrane protein [Saprospiraceae bacterium]|nr:OmpH family outer membrane protein [Saprospiraceae bacterium]MCB9329334.1 OmpH family outer membrane protein [Lewinellaceae bacterium]HPK10393.1 OmpH family outer membrane protein [Saprospiraceae bacterium]HPQ21536.1 OmpH family outer membrane protein [Saprospiraceae bacterium]HRX29808.1 OmpH family outer membrane protein [Saprospiraceae bacterium]